MKLRTQSIADAEVSVRAQVDRDLAALPESFGPPAEEVRRDATFEALDVDSLDLVELAQVIEDEFGIALKGDDVKDIKTVGEVIDLVVSRA